MSLLNTVKQSLGISNSKLDGEILDAIASAETEMKVSGAKATESSFDHGVLFRQAVKLYCRAWFNYQGRAEQWRQAYEKLADAIAMCGLYDTQEESGDAQQ